MFSLLDERRKPHRGRRMVAGAITRVPATGSVLGVDVGYSLTRKSSAACRLDWTAEHISWVISRFRAVEPERTTVLQNAADRPLLAAAFDGPLRSDLSVIGSYRAAEQMLTLGLRPLIGKPGQSSSPVGMSLNAAANFCASVVLETKQLRASEHQKAIHAYALVEAFPSTFLGVMIEDPGVVRSDRRGRSDTFFEHLVQSTAIDRLLRHLLPGRESLGSLHDIRNHDDRAGLVCALTALSVACGDFTAVGDANGWIVLPPREFVAPWAWHHLEANSGNIGGGLLIATKTLHLGTEE